MGYHVTIDSTAKTQLAQGLGAGEGRRSVKIGAYGSQVFMMALWLAAYAISGQPESKRVCGSLEPVLGEAGREALSELAKRTDRPSWEYHNLRNRPRLVEELVSARTNDATWITLARTEAAGYTFARGAQIKPFTDPALAALARLFDAVTADDQDQRLDAATVAELAPVMRRLVTSLGGSTWYETMVEVTEVFETAAASGAGIELG